MNKYYDMIDHVHMPKEQHERLRAELMEQTERKTNIIRPVWRRYAAAAALALCLMGTAVTAYAAVRNQWFDVFFNNSNTETEIMEELLGKASTEEVTAQDQKYKFTVRNHLYNKEQQMGLIICSFQFLKEDNTHLNVGGEGLNRVILKKAGMIDGQVFLKENTNKSERELWFRIEDESGQVMLTSGTYSYLIMDDRTEDGEYTIGIRYDLSMEDEREQMPNLILSLENAGDVYDNLKARLPESMEIENVRFVSEKNPEDVFVFSPIGMTLTITMDKADCEDNTLDHEIMNSLKVVTKNGTKTDEDMTWDNEGSVLLKETDETYTWFFQRPLTKLLDVSEIEYIELDGVRYSK